jgi:type IV pilus assembly protein PilO
MELSSLNELDFNESGEWPIAVKAIAIVILCLVVWGAGYYFIIKNKQVDLASAEAQEVTLKQTFNIKYAKAVNLEAYKEQMKEMRISFASMLQQLPRQSEVADLLVDVSSSGLVNGLEFELFKPEGEHPIDFYAELPIQMTVTGTYHQFGEFVSAVAALPRIVTMHDLELKPISENAEIMTMNIKAKTYRYFDEQE